MRKPKTQHTKVSSNPPTDGDYNSTNLEEDPNHHTSGRRGISLVDLAVDGREHMEVHPLSRLYDKIIDSIDNYNQRALMPKSGLRAFPETIDGRRDAIYAEVVPVALINEFQANVNQYGSDEIYNHMPEDVADALLSHI